MLIPFAFQQSDTVAAWTPLSLPLYGWYKGDAGVPVSTDGASVGSWNDQSGNSRNLAQVTTAKQPKFRTGANGVSGLPVVEFATSTGSADLQQLIDTSFPTNTGAGYSFYIIYRVTGTSLLYGAAFGIGSESGYGNSIYPRSNWPSTLGSKVVTVSGVNNYEIDAYSSNFVVMKLSRSSSTSPLKYKTTYTSENLTPSLSATNYNGFWLGGTSPGTAGSNSGSVGSKIAEVLVCNRELTTGAGSEEASLDAYFRGRYGFGLYAGTTLPVTSPALWIDGSRWDTLYSDAGTSLVTADAGAIQQANDLSGNGLNASQTVLGYRPQYRTPINGQNGLSAIQHNNTGWYFTTPSASLGEYTAFSVMTSGWTTGQYRAVFGHNYGATTGQAVMTTGGDNSPSWLGKYLLATGNGYSNLASVGATGPYGTLASQSAQLVTAVAGSSGSTVRLNGVSVATSSANQAITPSSAIYYLGYSGLSNDYHDGKTCETIIYPRILSGSEISQVEAYLKAKWNTP